MPDTVPPPAEGATEETPEQPPNGDLDVSFERWAKLAAKLFRRSIAMRAALIHEAGLDENWTEVDNHWFRIMESDLERGDRERLDAYLELVEQERARREEDGEELKSPCTELLNEAYPPPPSIPSAPGSNAAAETTPGPTVVKEEESESPPSSKTSVQKPSGPPRAADSDSG